MKKRRRNFGNEIERRRICTAGAGAEGDEGKSSFLLERQNVGDDALRSCASQRVRKSRREEEGVRALREAVASRQLSPYWTRSTKEAGASINVRTRSNFVLACGNPI